MADEQPEGGRPSSGKADRMQNGGNGPAIGSGKVLGSPLTDTLAAEMGYGVDGKTEVTFFGKTFIFAPVSLEDQDEAAADLERLNTTLLAFGMVKPTEPAESITPADLAVMLRVLSGNKEISELGACYNVALLFYNMDKQQRHALARLVFYSLRRWHDDITEEQVRRYLDYANMPVLLRLWFRKNLGVLDRFLSQLPQYLPPAPDKLEADLLEAETVNPAAFAALMSEEATDAAGEAKPEATPDEMIAAAAQA